MPTEKKSNIAVTGTFVGWGLTLLALVWQIAVKDAQYSLRLAAVESELIDLDERLDNADAFRLALASDLAEIKTDLLWIRKELVDMNTN